jgi:hypothetical protein
MGAHFMSYQTNAVPPTLSCAPGLYPSQPAQTTIWHISRLATDVVHRTVTTVIVLLYKTFHVRECQGQSLFLMYSVLTSLLYYYSPDLSIPCPATAIIPPRPMVVGQTISPTFRSSIRAARVQYEIPYNGVESCALRLDA